MKNSDGKPLAVLYGQFSQNLGWTDLPGSVRETALDLVADWIANAAAGFSSKIGKALYKAGLIRGGRALLLGSLERVDPFCAALVNGGASHALEFDDAFRAGLYHPGAPVISAAWAAACQNRISGRRFLTAVVAGYEVSMRLAEAVNPGHNTVWHTTGTIGSFGAAVSAAHCMGASADQHTGALGLAGTQAAGLWEILPDSPQAKGLHAGKAAASGLLAARLARQDLFGPSTIFEGNRGFFSAAAREGVDMDTCRQGLGQDFWMPKTTIKAYPVCGHAMTAIESALKLAGQIRSPKDIKKIEVRAHPVSFGIAGNPNPGNGLEARFSIAYCVVAALLRHRITLDEFSPAALENEDVTRLMAKTTVISDDVLVHPEGFRPARVCLTLADGTILSETKACRKGDPENPMTGNELKAKFIGLVKDVWGRETGQDVYESVRSLQECDDFSLWTKKTFESKQKTNQITAE
ncbi:MmgE/PrpD family protein [Desulfospira joergensenii]|uniref:MmgE/PrpD family protein n=1 Tax=Desulfospira joergensenii TaxID=53329 RepID=UPI0003B38D28|nr:MmgE/PrpD family protein [Desulfospira joergensenii]